MELIILLLNFIYFPSFSNFSLFYYFTLAILLSITIVLNIVYIIYYYLFIYSFLSLTMLLTRGCYRLTQRIIVCSQVRNKVKKVKKIKIQLSYTVHIIIL